MSSSFFSNFAAHKDGLSFENSISLVSPTQAMSPSGLWCIPQFQAVLEAPDAAMKKQNDYKCIVDSNDSNGEVNKSFCQLLITLICA